MNDAHGHTHASNNGGPSPDVQIGALLDVLREKENQILNLRVTVAWRDQQLEDASSRLTALTSASSEPVDVPVVAAAAPAAPAAAVTDAPPA
jgi:hypothetical protein